MKNCKMAFTIGLVFAVMMLVAACTDSNKSDNHIFDHESLDVDEYVYPSDFDLGDDLKGTNSESDAGFEELSAMISQCVPRWLVRSIAVWKSGIGPPVLYLIR